MDRRTIDFYTKNAERLSARYLQADMSPLYRDIIPELPPGGSVLEIGCGNGRDARNLAAQGFRVTATDASEGMLEEATRLTRGNNPLFLLRAFPLKPSELLPSWHYDLILCVGVLMHIPDWERAALFRQMRALLAPNGIVLLTWTNSAPDPERLHVPLPPHEAEVYARTAGLRVRQYGTSPDALGRELEWFTLILEGDTKGE